MDNDKIIKAVLRSQRCQRNWDLSRQIPQEDLEVIEAAVTQCPSKQNLTFYKPLFVTNREKIEAIHNASMLAGTINKESKEYVMRTQSQLLANLLVVLVEDHDPSDLDKSPSMMSHHTGTLPQDIIDSHIQYYNNDMDRMLELFEEDYKRDKATAVGIAAGYMNLAASLMGYSTGCCQCFDMPKVQQILGVQGQILLIMGIGLKDEKRNRREHHVHPTEMFPTNQKSIKIDVIE